MTFMQKLLANKTVAVWGMGYLGYTTLIRLQAHGFKSICYDFSTKAEDFLSGAYPDERLVRYWSKSGHVHKLDFNKIKLAENPSEMAEACVNVVAFPLISDSGSSMEAFLSALKEHHLAFKECLFVFQAMEGQSMIQDRILDQIPFSMKTLAAFRSDWCYEDFIRGHDERVLAGNTAEALQEGKALFDYFGIHYHTIESIEEAEIYENSKLALQSLVQNYLNQLTLAFPDVNIKKISALLNSHLSERDFVPGVDTVDYRTLNSISNLLQSSCDSAYLTLAEETQKTNISFLMEYADLLIKNSCKNVLLMGIASGGSARDIRLSPSIILGEYLLKNGVQVSIWDQGFSKAELSGHIKDIKLVTFEEISDVDAVVVLRERTEFRALSSQEITDSGICRVKLVIDFCGLFRQEQFSDATLYHSIGDGTLGSIKR